MENLTKSRLQVVQQQEDIEKIEEMIDCGEIEELIEQAKDELRLLPEMLGKVELILCLTCTRMEALGCRPRHPRCSHHHVGKGPPHSWTN